jgi:hypothetical protein
MPVFLLNVIYVDLLNILDEMNDMLKVLCLVLVISDNT